MAAGKTSESFLEFLDWMAQKGLLPLNTAHGRKAVANKVLAALEPEELADVTLLDIDNVMLRFSNKFGKRYTPDSLRTYRSRFESSISDFKSYLSDPVGFRPGNRPSMRRKSSEDGIDSQPSKADQRRRKDGKAASVTVERTVTDEISVPSGNVIPVQIRENLTVRIGPIPFDLTSAEARRLANVITALAIADEF